MNLDQPLSVAELDELESFLASDEIMDTSMDVATLEGMLTALVIGPAPVAPSDWLPWVWDMEEGIRQPEFESAEQVNHILTLIMRHSNTVATAFAEDPSAFKPIFWHARQWGVGDWCEGFFLGMQFNEALWESLSGAHPEWFKPLLMPDSEDATALIENDKLRTEWVSQLCDSFSNIYQYWLVHRDPIGESEELAGYNDYLEENQPVTTVVRGGPKIGRNDPCPCGSGKKFKHCCGTDGTPPTLH